MKRILSVILCLAVFLSSMVIGVISTASAEGAGAVVTPSTTVTATGAPESAGTLDGVTAKAGELKADEDGNYYLTGDITVDSADDLAAVKTALDAGKTFDGKGYTITTSVPLFAELSGGTFKNFTVKGEVVVAATASVIANKATGSVAFENVKVAATLKTTAGGELSGFVGNVSSCTVSFKNCAFTGVVEGTSSATESKAGGFVAKMVGSADKLAGAVFENCTSDGKLTARGHMGGLVIDANSYATVSATNCVVDMDATTVANGTCDIGGVVGCAKNAITVNGLVVSGTVDVGANGGRLLGGVVGCWKPQHTNPSLTVNDYLGTVEFKNIQGGYQTGGIMGGSDNTTYATTGSIKFTNCTVESKYSIREAVADSKLGGFIGFLQMKKVTVEFDNCVNKSDIVILSTGGSAWAAAGFIGRMQNVDNTVSITFTECVNEGDVIIDSYAARTGNAWSNQVGGFIGLCHANPSITFDKCVNNGDIAAYNHNVSAGIGNAAIGGFIGNVGMAATIAAYDCVNSGTVTAASRTGVVYAGGFMASSAAKNITIDSFINTGDVSAVAWNGNGYSYNASDYALGDMSKGTEGTSASTSSKPRAAGIIGSAADGTVGAATIESSINIGNIVSDNKNNADARAAGIIDNATGYIIKNTVNAGSVSLTTSKEGQPCGGIAGLISTGSVLDYCVNLGDVTSTSTYTGAIAAANFTTTTAGVTNCVNAGSVDGSFISYTCAAEAVTGTDLKGCYALEGSVDVVLKATDATVETPEFKTFSKALPAYCTPDNTKSVNAKAYITLILANIDADLASAYVADEFKGDREGEVDRLNNLVNPDVIFGVTFDKDLYDAIEAIAGDENVKVEGIVTLSKYVEKIGEFTHEALDAYYEANAEALAAKNVTKLYMDATRTETNLGSGDLVDGDYFVNIRLIEGNAGTVATTYTARAFIQIGDAYIYSSIIADAE